jgi:hypothetical protein
VDDHRIIQQFETIESKVEQLIDLCRAKDAANIELAQKIERLEEELQTKAEADNRYRAEREAIRSRIDQLLLKLEDIAGA